MINTFEVFFSCERLAHVRFTANDWIYLFSAGSWNDAINGIGIHAPFTIIGAIEFEEPHNGGKLFLGTSEAVILVESFTVSIKIVKSEVYFYPDTRYISLGHLIKSFPVICGQIKAFQQCKNDNDYLRALPEITHEGQAFKAAETTRLRNWRTTGREDGNWRDTLWNK